MTQSPIRRSRFSLGALFAMALGGLGLPEHLPRGAGAIPSPTHQRGSRNPGPRGYRPAAKWLPNSPIVDGVRMRYQGKNRDNSPRLVPRVSR